MEEFRLERLPSNFAVFGNIEDDEKAWFVIENSVLARCVIVADGCEGKVLGGGRPLFKIS